MSLTLTLGLLMAGLAKAPQWDWNGVLGTGQSLSVGGAGLPIESVTQPFNNLKLASGDLTWPVSFDDPKLHVEPLTEPVGRRSVGFPSSWPQHIDGETAHTSSGNQISDLVQKRFHRDYVTVHYEVGEAGQGMNRIRKVPVREGVAGRSYEAALIQTRALVRLAKEAGKSFGVGAIFMTHGESDTGNNEYADELYRFWSDYNGDLKAITGQKQDVLMIVSQHNRLGEYSPSTIAQWKVAKDHPEHIVCSGPKYQYPYGGDALHMTAKGYQMLGEKYGQVYYERVVLGRRWRPLEPESVARRGDVLTVRFHVPVKPLVWDASLGSPHPSTPEWSQGKGFELVDSSGSRVGILSADLRGVDSVVLKLARDPGPGSRLSYALLSEPTMKKPPFNAAPHWGLLRDSDPFVGYNTKRPQPNYCVAFDMMVP